MTSLLSFQPFDTLWFREGRPFEQMDEGLAEARAVFPPSPSTLAGAIAASLNPLGPESKTSSCMPQLRRMVLGDEQAEDQISFAGPFLVDSSDALYVPAPATLGAKKMQRGDALKDHRNAINTHPEHLALYYPAQGHRVDGHTWLPQLKLHSRAIASEFENLATVGAWIGVEDFFRHMKSMRSFMAAERLHRPLIYSDSFKSEQRVGIAIDKGTRTAADGQLYSAQHLRPHEDEFENRHYLSMLMDQSPSDAGSDPGGRVVSLGGKGRASRIASRPYSLRDAMPKSSPDLRNASGELFFRLTAMTPVPVDHKPWGLPSLTKFLKCSEGDVTVHTAIMPTRPSSVGIWNRFASDGHTRRIVRCHAPGTVWFVSVSARALGKEQQKSIAHDILSHRFVPGEMTSLGAMGFGMLALGEWPKDLNS